MFGKLNDAVQKIASAYLASLEFEEKQREKNRMVLEEIAERIAKTAKEICQMELKHKRGVKNIERSDR